MTLLTEIKEQQLIARKSHDTIAAPLLTTLIGDVEMVGKNAGREVTDAEIIATIKKFLKNIDITLENLEKFRSTANSLAIDKPLAEKRILEKFLPKQLTEEILNIHINSIDAGLLGAGEKSDMGAIMRVLKSRFDGQYDSKLATIIIKKVLAG